MSGAMLLNVLLMDEPTATAIAAETADWQNRLAPRLVAAGPEAGRWVLPAVVAEGLEQGALRDMLDGLEAGGLDAEIAWPVEED